MSASGGSFENLVLALFAFGADGRLRRAEVWEPDREAETLARFDALAGGEAEPASGPFDNAASEADRKLFECFNTRD